MNGFPANRLPPLFLALLLASTLLLSRQAIAQAKCPWLNAATAAGILGGEVELNITALNVTAPPGQPEAPPLPATGQATQSSASAPIYPSGDSEPQRKDNADISCSFRRKVGPVTYALRIQVQTMAKPAEEFAAYLLNCPSKVSLTAIGNEAYQCRQPATAGKSDDPGKPVTEEVVARVRNRLFVLTIDDAPSASPIEAAAPIGATAPVSTKDSLRPDTRNMAEQIAGSLF